MIKGIFHVFMNGEHLTSIENDITVEGRKAILRYLADDIGNWSGAIAVGVGDTANVMDGTWTTLSTETELEFEVGRNKTAHKSPLIGSDPSTDPDHVLIKTEMPKSLEADVWELGIYSAFENVSAKYSSQHITDFNPNFTDATNAVEDSVNSRIGSSGSQVSASASTSTTATFTNIRFNGESFSDSDEVKFAYWLHDGNCNSIELRLQNDADNYWTHTIDTSAQTAGFYVVNIKKSNFGSSGRPNWSDDIIQIEAVVTAGSGGATDVTLDGLRFINKNIYPDYVLVSRAVLGSKIDKNPSNSLEVEYEIQFSW